MTGYKVKIGDVVANYKVLAENTKALCVPMLKANAYGLGAPKVLDALEKAGVETFAFSRLEEALALESESTFWILTCYHGAEQLQTMLEKDYVFAVDSVEQATLAAEIAANLGKTARVHLAVDTGFGRFGFAPDKIEEMLWVCHNESIQVEGIFSHLGAAFLYKDNFADKQLALFLQTVEELRQSGAEIPLCHIANSSALLRDEKFHLDAVRVGSALCGRLPVSFSLPLRRVGQFVSPVVDIRLVPKGQNIGYGKVYRTKRDTKVAIVAVGSADGVQLAKDYDAFRLRDFVRYIIKILKMMFRRDNRMRVRVNGKNVAVLGRVALTHMMLDVTNVECNIGDEVTIPISPLMVADHIERIYE